MAIDEKPSRNEDEYFVRMDAERAQQERASHLNKCPKCGTDLTERELHQVKVDFCPSCGGMWLDAGELDLVRDSRRSGISRFVDDLFGIDR